MILEAIKHLSTPGTFSPNLVAIGGYFALMAIFSLEAISTNEIPLQVLYIFPLTAIAIHCEKKSQVVGAVILSIGLQVVTLLSYEHVSVSSKIIISIIILASNAMVASVARYAREHYLEAERLATIDWLTGLHNRRSLELITDKEIARHKRYGGVFSFALVDLDNFKELNDSRGHPVGDEALKILAEVLRKQTRESDTVARLGGDEFAILMPNTLAVDSALLCEQLSAKVTRRMADAAFSLTVSIGCTTFENTPEATSEVFKKVDQAMYSAKANGKGCVVSL
ncbi:MAG TPA: GGDEF domain-containing protein [Acidobacteriota bacterium]|nr:GGDEF domain-containing protein [Acidobacteriota bacterium]